MPMICGGRWGHFMHVCTYVFEFNMIHVTVQEDLAFKEKQREEKKKLAEAQARASQKGPMGELAVGQAGVKWGRGQRIY